MLVGFSGTLVAGSFVEESLLAAPPSADRERTVNALYACRGALAQLGPASSLRALLHEGAAMLFQAIGRRRPERLQWNGDRLGSTIQGLTGATTILVLPWGTRLEDARDDAEAEGASRGTPWTVVFNGVGVRIVDARREHAGRHAEFDLRLALHDARACSALAGLMDAAAEGLAGGNRLDMLVASSDARVHAVCRDLRRGVLEATERLLSALGTASRANLSSPDHVLEQVLTIVYRILFLLFAEARALVPMWHALYRDAYSLETLCASIELPHRAPGLWDAIRAISRLAHAGCRAGDLRVAPFNGRLFAPTRTPLAESRQVDDATVRQVLSALATRFDRQQRRRVRIGYGDLGVEQLGAVYETLLDYQPRPREGRPSALTLVRGSTMRKATGAFYTPQPLAQFLVRRTLRPLVAAAAPDEILNLRVLDPAMGSGAFLVAACRFLADAYEEALVRSGGCPRDGLSETDRIGIRRLVAGRCLYGVDVNPMAVQLGRLSLWLVTLAANHPLSFLDHRLQVGNSLVGAWLADVRTPPERRRRTGGRQPALFDSSLTAAVLDVLPARFSLALTPNDTPSQVKAKERLLASVADQTRALARWKRVADLWCSRWFDETAGLPGGAFLDVCDSVLDGRSALPEATSRRYLEAAQAIGATHRFFHWELEYPEVFFERDGTRQGRPGFDAVIGNPPWDMLRADAHRQEGPGAGDVGLLRFARDSGAYQCEVTGHLNRYQLFVERAAALTRPGGRLGLVVPSGFGLDHGSAPLRRFLFERCRVDGMVGIDNHQGVFPIHRSLSVLLLSATTGSGTTRFRCRFGVSNPSTLDAVEHELRRGSAPVVELSPGLLERLSGPSLAIPRCRSTRDLALAERLTEAFAPLGRAWSVAFSRELNASDDRPIMHDAGHGLPVVDGKHLDAFRVHTDQTTRRVARADAVRRLPDRRWERRRLGYRDVSGATNRMTLIAAMLPGDCLSTHTVFCLRTRLPLVDQHLLCALFNSFVLNWLVRLRVTTHVTTAIVEQLPVPPRHWSSPARTELAALGRRLSRGHDVAVWARLQALVAWSYGLRPAEFEYLLTTFPLVPADARQEALRELTAVWRRSPAS